MVRRPTTCRAQAPGFASLRITALSGSAGYWPFESSRNLITNGERIERCPKDRRAIGTMQGDGFENVVRTISRCRVDSLIMQLPDDFTAIWAFAIRRHYRVHTNVKMCRSRGQYDRSARVSPHQISSLSVNAWKFYFWLGISRSLLTHLPEIKRFPRAIGLPVAIARLFGASRFRHALEKRVAGLQLNLEYSGQRSLLAPCFKAMKTGKYAGIVIFASIN